MLVQMDGNLNSRLLSESARDSGYGSSTDVTDNCDHRWWTYEGSTWEGSRSSSIVLTSSVDFSCFLTQSTPRTTPRSTEVIRTTFAFFQSVRFADSQSAWSMNNTTAAKISQTVTATSGASSDVFRCFTHVLSEEHTRAETTEAASRTIRTAAKEALWKGNEELECFEYDAMSYLAMVEHQQFVSQSSFVSLTSISMSCTMKEFRRNWLFIRGSKGRDRYGTTFVFSSNIQSVETMSRTKGTLTMKENFSHHLNQVSFAFLLNFFLISPSNRCTVSHMYVRVRSINRCIIKVAMHRRFCRLYFKV